MMDATTRALNALGEVTPETAMGHPPTAAGCGSITPLVERSAGPITLPTTNLLPTWWHYDIPNPPTSATSDLLEGSYLWAPGPGVSVLWKWQLTRIR